MIQLFTPLARLSSILLTVLLLSLAPTAWADPPKLSAPDAAARLASGELVLLDIRAPQEWKDSGVAQGAWPVSMHTQAFSVRLRAILQHYRPEQIALICATGGRSAYVAEVLEKNGLSGVIDVSEGMLGNGTAPGWLERGMPVVSAQEASRAFEEVQATWQ